MTKKNGYTLGNRKVAIVGDGYVGSSIVYALALHNVAKEIVLIDTNYVKMVGEVKDIRHGLSGIGTGDLVSGCILDSLHYARTIADYVELSTGVINGYVVGEHGDCQVPVWSYMTVGGIPIAAYCSDV